MSPPANTSLIFDQKDHCTAMTVNTINCKLVVRGDSELLAESRMQDKTSGKGGFTLPQDWKEYLSIMNGQTWLWVTLFHENLLQLLAPLLVAQEAGRTETSLKIANPISQDSSKALSLTGSTNFQTNATN